MMQIITLKQYLQNPETVIKSAAAGDYTAVKVGNGQCAVIIDDTEWTMLRGSRPLYGAPRMDGEVKKAQKEGRAKRQTHPDYLHGWRSSGRSSEPHLFLRAHSNGSAGKARTV